MSVDRGHAATWARTIIDNFGVAHRGTWLIPYTQAELARRLGLEPTGGTISAYLAALDDIVVQRRGGIILDDARLTDVESRLTSPAHATARSHQIARDLTLRLGHPTPQGTILVVADRHGNPVPASLADMSAVLGLHRSTIHNHLRRLAADHRVLYDRGTWTFPPHPAAGGAAAEPADRAQP